jgi:hypothetical protein
MPQNLGARIRDYYDVIPAAGNNAGDIWSGLPTFGLLGDKPLTGIVITPACDLSNRKVETITYLPVVPVRAYFATLAFLPEIFRGIEGQLQAAQLPDLISAIERPGRFAPPPLQAIQALGQELEEASTKPCIREKSKTAVRRAMAGVRLLACVSGRQLVESPLDDLKLLFGDRSFKSILKGIVNNSYRLDIHFLPSDEQDVSWSGVPEHSLVLFRYAFSAPMEIFECAQDLSLADWSATIHRLSAFAPGVSTFLQERPMKRVSLKPHFLADLMTRYVAMYVRLGSLDFTHQTRSLFVDQIGGY